MILFNFFKRFSKPVGIYWDHGISSEDFRSLPTLSIRIPWYFVFLWTRRSSYEWLSAFVHNLPYREVHIVCGHIGLGKTVLLWKCSVKPRFNFLKQMLIWYLKFESASLLYVKHKYRKIQQRKWIAGLCFELWIHGSLISFFFSKSIP